MFKGFGDASFLIAPKIVISPFAALAYVFLPIYWDSIQLARGFS